ncbi:Extracellular metalloproteinase NpI OS=Aspergillus oryzae (strain ATCC 42149 / RIB 40) GN=NpI PE=2 SV=1 [Rhizoctonia solani AG-1 IB]|uniref:Extracellular metalloproteinase n=1 Tax=Thanatephorus cucumeris (strain AG1-IB / isolate 7/3/14) TaxID=1108050 RepID=A0A0B7FVY5_THACB|nr:Extracellular metalloproteinase NpI OS=Aspergillus oryzae (strain ATCC 42149 / RIB 40) GN=NpI PE=2 SV=1 [Rhizoctonia solani AG-1 IB]
MVSLTSLSAVALLIASGVIAAPWHSNIPHHTHRSRGVGPTGINLVSYHPPSVFEGYGVDGAPFQSVSQRPEEIAKSFLQEKLGLADDELIRHAGHTNDGVSYDYFTQTTNGIPISNTVANVATKDGNVVSYGASFIKPTNIAPKEPTIGQDRAIALSEEALGGKWNGWPVKLEYTMGDGGSCHLTWAVQVQGQNSWKQLSIDAHDGKVRNVVDFVAEHSYHVVPFSYQDPDERLHDLTYLYGFTEAAYNFQQENFRKGGKEGDRVQVSVQDSSGANNANFATPPDGQPGRMRMFIWTATSPNRDGALENDIITHEFVHGVSNRLTGGGTGACLQTTEAGGMGEGWSDAMADITEAKTKPIPDFTLGSYVVNNPKGIRSYPYSTNMATNPLTYGNLKTMTEVHDIGEVWAVTLHELLNSLVEKCGLSKKLDPSEESGNSIVL